MCFVEYEKKQMEVNRYVMPDNIGRNLILIYKEESNWDIYYNYKEDYCYAIAKPISSCNTSCFGKVSHIKNLIRQGHFKKSSLTKYGRKLVL